MVDVGHLTIFGDAASEVSRRPVTSPLLDLPGAVVRRRHRRAAWPRTTAPSTASSARSSPATASSTSPTATWSGSSGPDRLTWLHSLTTQHLEALAPKVWTGALVLSPQGHVEHAFFGVRRRRGVHRPHRARARRGAGRVPRPDAVHDARRGHRRDRRARRHLAPGRPRRGDAVRRLRAGPARPAHGVRRGRRAGRAACGRSRRCGSRAASPGSASTPTTARSPTRSAGSARPCTSTRAATAARRPSPGCTRWAGRRAG